MLKTIYLDLISYQTLKNKIAAAGILKDMKKRESWCKFRQLMGEFDDCREASQEMPLGKSIDSHTMRSLILYILAVDQRDTQEYEYYVIMCNI